MEFTFCCSRSICYHGSSSNVLTYLILFLPLNENREGVKPNIETLKLERLPPRTEMLKTSLTSFYKNKVIFLIGSSGFLGTAVAEKLLRTFPDIGKLILLMRPSRTLSVEDRIRTLTSDVAFSRIKPDVLYNKITWVAGDLSSEKLGLSDESLKTLVDSVNVVLHCAATINLEEPMRRALTVNLKGTHEVLKIASGMKNLKSFIYVSTCYSNCNRNKIEEKLYPNKFPPNLLLQLLDLTDENLNEISPNILQDWPNTYTFSKNAAELLVNEYREKLPVGIFRTSNIIPSYKEPFPSWIQKDFGPNFVIVGACLGLVKVLPTNSRGNIAFVPVDMTASGLLAAAWEVAQEKLSNKDVNIYNYSSIENPLTMRNYVKFSLKHVDECKFGKTFGRRPKMYVITSNDFLYTFFKLFKHTMPAHTRDVYAKLTGNKPRFVNLYKNYDERMDLVKPFREFNLIFTAENVNKLWNRLTKEEQKLLYFDVKSVDWERCLSSTVFGIKKYYFKEPLTEGEREQYQKYINDK